MFANGHHYILEGNGRVPCLKLGLQGCPGMWLNCDPPGESLSKWKREAEWTVPSLLALPSLHANLKSGICTSLLPGHQTELNWERGRTEWEFRQCFILGPWVCQCITPQRWIFIYFCSSLTNLMLFGVDFAPMAMRCQLH